MNNLKKLNRRIVELNHPECDSYEEALEKEFIEQIKLYHEAQIHLVTLSRVFQAMNNARITCVSFRPFYMDSIQFERSGKILLKWKLTKENGETATTEDQTQETINKLLKLLTQ